MSLNRSLTYIHHGSFWIINTGAHLKPQELSWHNTCHTRSHDNNWLLVELALAIPFALGYKVCAVAVLISFHVQLVMNCACTETVQVVSPFPLGMQTKSSLKL